MPDAAVLAIEAGCDGVLICSGDHDAQAAALEALVHAVEERAVSDRPGRRRAQAAAAREGAVSRRPGCRRGRRTARRCARRSAATSIARSPTRWPASRDAQAARAAPGDRLAVVAPASPFDREEFDRGVEEIRRLGFEPVYDESVFARRAYVAGAADVRAAAHPGGLARSRRSPASIAVRGGYGSAQVLPLLDPHEVRARPSRSSATAI